MAKITFELPADDMKRAMEFYEQAFGWTSMPLPVGSAAVDTDGEPVDPSDADGVFTPRNEFVKAPVLLIPTDNIDETIEKVKDAGGEILTEKEKVGEFGYSAYGKDTEGTIFCLWQQTL